MDGVWQVLAAMVEEAVQEGVSRGNGNGAQSQQLGRAVWELISTTLAAGAAALTVNAAAAARQAVITLYPISPMHVTTFT